MHRFLFYPRKLRGFPGYLRRLCLLIHSRCFRRRCSSLVHCFLCRPCELRGLLHRPGFLLRFIRNRLLCRLGAFLWLLRYVRHHHGTIIHGFRLIRNRKIHGLIGTGNADMLRNTAGNLVNIVLFFPGLLHNNRQVRIGMLQCQFRRILHPPQQIQLHQTSGNGKHTAQQDADTHGNSHQAGQCQSRRNARKTGCQQAGRFQKQHTGNAKQHPASQQHTPEAHGGNFLYKGCRYVGNHHAQKTTNQKDTQITEPECQRSQHNAANYHGENAQYQAVYLRLTEWNQAGDTGTHCYAGDNTIQRTGPAHQPAACKAQQQCKHQNQHLYRCTGIQRRKSL